MCGLPHKVSSLVVLFLTKASALHEQSRMANVHACLIRILPDFPDRQETSPGKASQTAAPFQHFLTKMEEKSNLAMQKLK